MKWLAAVESGERERERAMWSVVCLSVCLSGNRREREDKEGRRKASKTRDERKATEHEIKQNFPLGGRKWGLLKRHSHFKAEASSSQRVKTCAHLTCSYSTRHFDLDSRNLDAGLTGARR